MSSGQEMERVYYYNPGACTGWQMERIPISRLCIYADAGY